MPSDQSIHWVNKYFKMLNEIRWAYSCNICLYESGSVAEMRHHVTITHGDYQTLPFSSLMNTEDESSQNRKIKK
jgi:hypothetical protein